MLHNVRSRCSRNNGPLLRAEWRRVCKLTRPAPASQIGSTRLTNIFLMIVIVAMMMCIFTKPTPASQIGTSTRLTNIFLLPNALAHNEIQFQLLMRSSVLAYCQIRVHASGFILLCLEPVPYCNCLLLSPCMDPSRHNFKSQKWNF